MMNAKKMWTVEINLQMPSLKKFYEGEVPPYLVFCEPKVYKIKKNEKTFVLKMSLITIYNCF